MRFPVAKNAGLDGGLTDGLQDTTLDNGTPGKDLYVFREP